MVRHNNRSQRRTLRRFRSPRVQPVVDDAKKSQVDTWLQRLAHISQPALLILGAFGYFYTVRPIFQYQRLEEQTAKLEIDKSAAKQQLLSLKGQQSEAEGRIRQLEKSSAIERAKNEELAKSASLAESRELTARQRTVEAERNLKSQMQILDKARWELVFVDFWLSTTLDGSRAIDALYQNRDDAPGEFITASAAAWSSPYEELLSATEDAETRAKSRNDIPSSYYEELKKLFAAHRTELQCSKPDFESMHAEYIKERNSIDSEVEPELDQQLKQLKEEYAAKNQRVQISDQTRSAFRASIRIGKLFELEQKYRDKIKGFRKACDDKKTGVINEIRREKGVVR